GWPISHAELEPYIRRAAALLDIDTDFFDPHKQLASRELTRFDLIDNNSEALVTKNFQLASDIRVERRVRKEIGDSPSIVPVEHLNAIEVVLDDNGRRVDHIRAATLTGKVVTLRADRFVLCCHAIENA